MTNFVTSFELTPAGTAIPTTGSAGDGDAFTAGTNGTGASWTSDSTAAAIAAGSLCARLDIGTTVTTTQRTWGGLTLTTVHSRLYLYLPAAPNASWDMQSVFGAAITRRVRVTSALNLQHVLTATATHTTSGTIPLNTLVRIESTFVLSSSGAASFAIDVYTGHSTTPISGLSISGSGLTDSAASATGCRFGCIANGPTSFTAYFDGAGISDTARLGPLAPDDGGGSYTPHVYVTAELTGDGVSTAVLATDGAVTATLSGATVGGFGLDFGLSFGEPTVMGSVTATVTSPPATAVLASNGTSTATLAPAPAVAELQLV